MAVRARHGRHPSARGRQGRARLGPRSGGAGPPAGRRGGGGDRITLSLDDAPTPSERGPDTRIEINALVDALERLDSLDARKADVVKLRLVWGMEMKEIGETLGDAVGVC